MKKADTRRGICFLAYTTQFDTMQRKVDRRYTCIESAAYMKGQSVQQCNKPEVIFYR